MRFKSVDHRMTKLAILLVILLLLAVSQGCALKSPATLTSASAATHSTSAQSPAPEPTAPRSATAQSQTDKPPPTETAPHRDSQEAEALRKELTERLFGSQQTPNAGAAQSQRRDSPGTGRSALTARERQALAHLAATGAITPEQFQNYLDHGSFNRPSARDNRARPGDTATKPQYDAQSVRVIRLAAEQGDVAAQNNLGVMYAEGQGVPQDDVLAHKWFNLAAAQGNRIAAQNRDVMVSRMPADQIGEAQRLAREWSAGNRSR